MKKIVSLLTVTLISLLLLSTAAVAYTVPTLGYKWPTRVLTVQNNATETNSINSWNRAIYNWNLATNVTLAKGTNSNFILSTHYISDADWDGMSNLTYSESTMLSARCYLNEYHTQIESELMRNGVATHEVGHALGLADEYDYTKNTVMYKYTYNTDGSIARMNNWPTDDDKSTINSLYPSSLATTLEKSLTNTNVSVLMPSWAVYYKDYSELAVAADLVIEGTIKTDSDNKYDKKGDYVSYRTLSQVDVQKVLKGNNLLEKQVITLSQLGGKDDTYTVISDTTTYVKKGNKVVLFLKQNDDGTYRAINENQSIFIKNDVNKYVNQLAKENLDIIDIEAKIKLSK